MRLRHNYGNETIPKGLSWWRQCWMTASNICIKQIWQVGGAARQLGGGSYSPYSVLRRISELTSRVNVSVLDDM